MVNKITQAVSRLLDFSLFATANNISMNIVAPAYKRPPFFNGSL
jgi:hypothetical protein